MTNPDRSPSDSANSPVLSNNASDRAHLPSPAPLPPRSPTRTPEGRILRLGLVLGAVYLAGLVGTTFFAPRATPLLGTMTALNVLVGRAAGMTWGYANGLPHSVVIPTNALIETIQVLTVYPLFVLSWHHLLEIRALKSLMDRTRRAAEARRGVIRRFGILGLFVFVFTPFWMTGPVVGSVVGFLIGLPPRTNLGIVLGATYIAIGIWAALLHGLTGWAAAYHQYAPLALVGGLAILILMGRVLHRRLPLP